MTDDLSPDQSAEFDRDWMMMSADHRLVFVALAELAGAPDSEPVAIAEIAKALNEPDFRARVEARVNRLHQRVEAKILGEGSAA